MPIQRAHPTPSFRQSSSILLSREGLDALYDRTRYDRVVENQRVAVQTARTHAILLGCLCGLLFVTSRSALATRFGAIGTGIFMMLPLAAILGFFLHWLFERCAMQRLLAKQSASVEDKAEVVSHHIRTWFARKLVGYGAMVLCGIACIPEMFETTPSAYSARGVLFCVATGATLVVLLHAMDYAPKADRFAMLWGGLIGLTTMPALAGIRSLPIDMQSSLILLPVFVGASKTALLLLDRRHREANTLIAAGVLDRHELWEHGIGKGSRYEDARAVWLSRIEKSMQY